MNRQGSTVFIVMMAMLAGCSVGGWNPLASSGPSGPYTPPGAKGYACEGGKRLLVRFESDAKSAWVIWPDRETRLNRVAGAGEQFSNGRATLSLNDGEARVEEGGRVEFAGCKPEGSEPKTKG
jgi:hypothetical protein